MKAISRPSKKMLIVLNDMYEGRGTHHNCRGRSAHGGRCRILCALIRRGWIDRDYQITETGRSVLTTTT